MSLKDGMKAFAKGTYDAMQQKVALLEQRKERYRGLDDRQLIEKFKESTGMDKTACAQLLKERGYGNQ